MKTAQLPPIRVTPAVREEIELSLREGESLSQFVEATVLREARRRKQHDEFIARGRASIARAKQGAELVTLDEALDQMQARVRDRVAQLRVKPPKAAGKP